MKRCEECGSWEAECGSPTPVSDCQCARCLAAAVIRLQKERGVDHSFYKLVVEQRNRAWELKESLEAAVLQQTRELRSLTKKYEAALATANDEKVWRDANIRQLKCDVESVKAERDKALAEMKEEHDFLKHERDSYCSQAIQNGIKIIKAEEERDEARAEVERLTKRCVSAREVIALACPPNRISVSEERDFFAKKWQWLKDKP